MDTPAGGAGPPLTRAEVMTLLQEAGSSEKLDLRSRNLNGTSVDDMVHVGVKLSGADLRGADLRGADLRGADLKGSLVTAEQLAQVISLKDVIMPDGSIHL